MRSNTNYLYDNQHQWLNGLRAKSYNNGDFLFQKLDYSYDVVGNIGYVTQSAYPWYGMGGQYYDEYFYDSRYRLAQNLHDDSYIGTTDYSLTYSPTTRIGTKYSHHPALGQPDLLYAYDDSGLTHQTRVIHDSRTNTHMQLYWDANGNLREVKPYDGYPRFHLWGDDDRMIASIGSHTCGYYGTTIGGGNNGNWLINPVDSLTATERELRNQLTKSDIYRYTYYDMSMVGYPTPNDNTFLEWDSYHVDELQEYKTSKSEWIDVAFNFFHYVKNVSVRATQKHL